MALRARCGGRILSLIGALLTVVAVARDEMLSENLDQERSQLPPSLLGQIAPDRPTVRRVE
jgi:hypothetical protein